MAPRSKWSSLWRNLVHRDQVERELDDDLQAALELLIEAQGLPRDAAHRAAAMQLGVPLVPAGAPLPFLINETGARRFWPNEEAVGQRVRAPWGTGVVAGVVGDVHHLRLAQAPTPAVYFPHFIGPRVVTTIVASTAGDPTSMTGAVRQAIREIDPNQPIRSIPR